MGDIMKYDKIINVAIGKSRKELNYVNLKLPYSEFIDKYIKNTKYTNETFDKWIDCLLKGKRDEKSSCNRNGRCNPDRK